MSGFFVALFILVAAMAPLIAPYSYETQDLNRVLLGPNWINWFGTDSLGRDLFSRVLYGARVSLSVGLVTSLAALIVGTFYGAVAGYFGGWVESLLMRAADTIQSFPHMVLMILVAAIFSSFSFIEDRQTRSVVGIILALSLSGWVNLARLVRNHVLQIKTMPYIEAGFAAGAPPLRMIVRHIIPNLAGPLLVMFTYLIPNQILYESFLSFVGLGLQPPFSSWGVLVNEGWKTFRSYPHLILLPGLSMFVTMLALQFFGDSLRDRLDPKSSYGTLPET